MNKNRKKKLHARAVSIAAARYHDGRRMYDYADGFERGYRAAMVDLRKLERLTTKLQPVEALYYFHVFLRPLR